MSTQLPLLTAKVPPILTLPLTQHIGAAAEPVVKVGDHVLKGQLLAKAKDYVSASVHAPSSGTVVAIEKRPVPHPSGLSADCIVIETDGKDQWRWRGEQIEDYTKLDPSELRNRLRQAGVVGLGGAGFPTYVKINPGPTGHIDLLILNGVECEPYISCDEMLMQEDPWIIVGGMQILRHAVQAKECVIAIEDNMPEAYAAMQAAVESLHDSTVHVVKVPTVYPAGGEKQLIKVLTGMEVPSQSLPADIGVICQNVGTAAAVCKAVTERQPVISRVVTVTGSGIRQPRNVVALIGTHVSELVEECGGYTDGVYRLLMGGPFMGIPLPNDRLPITKTTNCLLAVTPKDLPMKQPARPCIRCGECAEVCPANLLPQQLFWHTLAKDFEKTRDFNLFDCIECGCCTHVCPSHIPLVQYYRHAKSEIWSRELAKQKSELANRRYEFRNIRLEREKRARAERMQRRKNALKSDKSADTGSSQAIIQAALERVKAKQAARSEKSPDKDTTGDT